MARHSWTRHGCDFQKYFFSFPFFDDVHSNQFDGQDAQRRSIMICLSAGAKCHSLTSGENGFFLCFSGFGPVPIFTSHSSISFIFSVLRSPLLFGSRYLTRLEFSARTPFPKRQSKSQMANIKSFGPVTVLLLLCSESGIEQISAIVCFFGFCFLISE